MVKFMQHESLWQSKIENDHSGQTIWCKKNIAIVNAENNKIYQGFIIALIIKRNEIIENLFYAGKNKGICNKIKSIFMSKSLDERKLGELRCLSHFFLYFAECNRNIGQAKIRLYTNYGEIIEKTMVYEYFEKNDSQIDFSAPNHFTAKAILQAFLKHLIIKIEFIPVEENTFNRFYFDLNGSDLYKLREDVEKLSNCLGFRITDI